MRLKSPTRESISFGTASGSGHCMVLGPDGSDVPQMFIQSAFAAGAVPAGADSAEFVAAPDQTQSKTYQDLIQDAIKVMLERKEGGDFTAAGLPDRRKLARIAGMNVTAEDVMVAWQAVNDAARS